MTATFGVDARAAAEVPAGRGRVVRELLRALAAPRRRRPLRPLRPRVDWTSTSTRQRFSGACSPCPTSPGTSAPRASRRRSCDAFLSTNSYLTCWFTTCPSAASSTTSSRSSRRAAQRRAPLIERWTIGIGVRRAGALACISEATRADLVDRVPVVGAARARHPARRGRALRRPRRRRGRGAGRAPSTASSARTCSPPGRSSRARTSSGCSRRGPCCARICAPRTSSSSSGRSAGRPARSSPPPRAARIVRRRLRPRRRARRAVRRLRAVLLSVALRGLRPAGARGDEGRRARPDVERLEPAGGRRRRRRARRPAVGRRRSRRDRAAARRPRRARPPALRGAARAAQFSWERTATETRAVLRALSPAAERGGGPRPSASRSRRTTAPRRSSVPCARRSARRTRISRSSSPTTPRPTARPACSRASPPPIRGCASCARRQTTGWSRTSTPRSR